MNATCPQNGEKKDGAAFNPLTTTMSTASTSAFSGMTPFTSAPSATPRIKVYRQTHVNPVGMSATVQVTVMDASYWVWISVRTQGEIMDEIALHQVTAEELRLSGRDPTRAFGDVSISMPPTKFQKVLQKGQGKKGHSCRLFASMVNQHKEACILILETTIVGSRMRQPDGK